ncbi:hypothetical protein QG034_00675 [Kingella kingae]|uniref:hypothetical protein n=1 Tax=Kingella kingae TaxID=504 RepID=UPI00041B11B0|nr:hypothetical protein [Kingella kingae]MDK4525437.1 hypothetical protein [Kingella kingae]MDK4531462.1 hypothetical protein [Kingella kingae]MDK4546121.1 hypothetical protein [Kingella kingae]MDK4621855.1 hypothetical protein [Kingella kingae]
MSYCVAAGMLGSRTACPASYFSPLAFMYEFKLYSPVENSKTRHSKRYDVGRFGFGFLLFLACYGCLFACLG